jgi:hypothetical protein
MNRKIRRAGRAGREVYIFALTVNAARGGKGVIPSADLDPAYIADMLMMPEVDAQQGVERALAADLLRANGDEIEITGWDDEWSWAPMTEAERKRRQRARTREAMECPDTVTPKSGHVTGAPDVSALSRDREEEMRKGRADASVGARKHGIPADWMTTDFADLNAAGIDGPGEVESFRDYYTADGATRADWNAAWRRWKRKAIADAQTKATNPRRTNGRPAMTPQEQIQARIQRLRSEEQARLQNEGKE